MAVLEHRFEETLLKVTDVSVTLGGTPILRDLSLEVKNITRPGLTQGQVVGLLGPSGIGKTTLFRILAGLDKPDTGTVLVKQEQCPVERGMVGVVAQNYPLFAHRTVLGNLHVAGRQAGLKGGQLKDKANKLLERFGIAEQASKYPVQLSGGQRQRVAIAQQFMCSEHFLLMDEPFSGLDMVAQEQVISFIQEMAAADELQTFILVTHDISAALEVSDTLWLLGRDRDAGGNIIPGAKIKASYNLIERGLAWREGISTTPEYLELRRELRELFPTL
jgi:polar amino acid transport system ATP-binding protein/sulfate transport system ATP-binding protein